MYETLKQIKQINVAPGPAFLGVVNLCEEHLDDRNSNVGERLAREATSVSAYICLSQGLTG